MEKLHEAILGIGIDLGLEPLAEAVYLIAVLLGLGTRQIHSVCGEQSYVLVLYLGHAIPLLPVEAGPYIAGITLT